jgi:enamine deaminase RidA (YjgF/YER057c/UK114 family)
VSISSDHDEGSCETIRRIPASGPGRSRVVLHGGLVYTVGTAACGTPDIAEQTRSALGYIDQHLAEAGTDKSRLLQVTLYLSDMADKPAMDAVWLEWIGGSENWPQRACVGVALAGQDRIEIVAIAAMPD